VTSILQTPQRRANGPGAAERKGFIGPGRPASAAAGVVVLRLATLGRVAAHLGLPTVLLAPPVTARTLRRITAAPTGLRRLRGAIGARPPERLLTRLLPLLLASTTSRRTPTGLTALRGSLLSTLRRTPTLRGPATTGLRAAGRLRTAGRLLPTAAALAAINAASAVALRCTATLRSTTPLRCLSRRLSPTLRGTGRRLPTTPRTTSRRLPTALRTTSRTWATTLRSTCGCRAATLRSTGRRRPTTLRSARSSRT
jgi:hypothetical protein